MATIRAGHRLLSDALKILGDESAREAISVPIGLLERFISAVDVAKLRRKAGEHDLWLYFYEDFLAVYDPKMRRDRGVYYTPVEVVQAQVRLVAELLVGHFGAKFSFVDPKVTTIDPAAGTGTYILAALRHGLDGIARAKGDGMKKGAASRAAENLYAFETLVGPYAVAHLRLTQAILAEEGSLPVEGVHVYLTDTLESLHAEPPQPPLLYKELGEEHKRAQRVKSGVSVLVCIGNPPCDRQQMDETEAIGGKRKGGWVRFGDTGKPEDGILRDFITPLAETGAGLHAKNLYNDYVYFWRWALWKIFESQQGPGIVSFITAASYLRGPGFAGMRRVMRETFDDLWIIDLEGDNLGARKTENVFAIQTPVAIAVGVRYGAAKPETPASVKYARIEGTREEKLAKLEAIGTFADLSWRECLGDWHEPFLPRGESDYWNWPLLTDLFPWQENGVKAGRTWPIAPDRSSLEKRWHELLMAKERKALFKDSPTGRKVNSSAPALPLVGGSTQPIGGLPPTAPLPPLLRYAYRSLDRQWLLADGRLLDRPNPLLWQTICEKQIFLTCFLTAVLGQGPAAVCAASMPDLDHFRGSFGGAHVIPLWQDAEGAVPNITGGVPNRLSAAYGRPVSAEDLFAYAYALLACPGYVQKFWEELTIPGPRLPVTLDADLFSRAAGLGHKLIWLHTYGERFVPMGQEPGRVPSGTARCRVGTPTDSAEYPETFHYDSETQELLVGEGIFEKVRPAVWEFSVSGFEVVKSWLGYRMKERSGKKSSPLDDIRPISWSFDEELLDLLWVLDQTVDLQGEMEDLLGRVLSGSVFRADDFPRPTGTERHGPARKYSAQEHLGLDLAAEP